MVNKRIETIRAFYEKQSKEKNYFDYLYRSFGKNIHKVRLNYVINFLDLDRLVNTSQYVILDLGCDDGVFTIELAKYSRNVIIGCDISIGRVYRTRKLLKAAGLLGKTGFVVCDASELPFRTESIQKVLCHHVLEHIPKDDNVLQEIERILPINGLLVLGVPNENSHFVRVRDILWWSKKTSLARSGHINKYSFATIQRKLKRYNLKIMNYQGVGLIIPFNPLHYFVLWVYPLFRIANSLGSRSVLLADSLLFKIIKVLKNR